MNNAPARLNFSAYPQPAASHLTLHIGGIDEVQPMYLSIYNLNGGLIETIEIDPQTKELPVNISAFKKGLYLVRLVQANQSFNGKLLIQK